MMVSLVFGLHALPHARAAPLPAIGPFVLAAAAFFLLLFVESRAKAPLVDLTFFARRSFVMGVAIGSLSMFSILSLLLYFNLYAQSREGLGLTALEAGAALLPLSAALLALALSASAVAARLGLRNAMRGGMALIAIASAVIGTAVAGGAVGSRAHASGAGVWDHQRLHLSWRQLRRCGRRHCLGAGGISRRADDDCARRHYRRCA
ncbi:MAG: multidrug efflux MFS transporter [Alphaproteobacteria bacterium]|nr:MAG: multidrug efflux MFS transporter [Alphaproteobacteria bacterium]